MDILNNDQLISIFQIVIGLSVIRVWTINLNKPSSWRGGSALNMRDEFEAYGLPPWMMYLVGTLKVVFSVGLLVGLWVPEIVKFSAQGIAILMFCAILMHLKIKDPIIKSIPSITFMILSLLIVILES